MAVNYHQPSVIALFDAMPVAMLTFGVSGKVTFANIAAKQHPGRPMESMDDKPVIKSLVADAVLGRIKLPYPAEIELANGHRMKGNFMAGPAGLDVAFMAHADMAAVAGGGKGGGRMTLKETIAMLRDEISPPMAKFIKELRAMPTSEASSSMEDCAKALHMRLSRLADLVDVFGDDIALANDRLEIPLVFKELCTEMQARAAAVKVVFELQTSAQTLPPIYGNEKLIRRALYECLENAVEHSTKEVGEARGSTVIIRFTMTGNYLLINIQNRGASQVKVTSKDVLTPFAAPGASAKGSVPRLGLPLVQRIVGLHGGNMRLGTSNDGSANVLIEFPTGAPQRVQNQLDIAQTQRYAADLAQLMSRRKKEKV